MVPGKRAKQDMGRTMSKLSSWNHGSELPFAGFMGIAGTCGTMSEFRQKGAHCYRRTPLRMTICFPENFGR